jgi:hypothetical protein
MPPVKHPARVQGTVEAIFREAAARGVVANISMAGVDPAGFPGLARGNMETVQYRVWLL